MSQRFGAPPFPGVQAMWDGGPIGLPDAPLTNLQMQQLFRWIEELASIHGLLASRPLVLTDTSRRAGPVSQRIVEAGDTTTVTRA
ncbi:MAG TPA: hypothetical protein VGE36_04655 [Roseateles sp.]